AGLVAAISGQLADDDLAAGPQLPDRAAQGGVARAGSADRRPGRRLRHQLGHFLHVEAEADRRPGAAEDRSDLVVAAAADDRRARALGVDRETSAAVIGV